MKLYVLLIMIFFFIQYLNSQIYDENQVVWNFKDGSNVKTIVVNEAFITKPFCKIKFVKQHIPFYNIYKFNEFGNLMQSTMFDGQYVVSDTVIFYEGNRKEKLNSIDSLNVENNQYTEFYYNVNGKLEKEIKFNLNGTKIKEERLNYPSKHKEIRSVYYGDTLNSWISKDYSLLDNNLIQISFYQSDSTLLNSISFTYDSFGNRIKCSYSNKEGVIGVSNFVYDNNNILIQSTLEDYTYNFHVSFEYSYKYDNNNNWIERTCNRVWYTHSTGKHEKEYLLISREITY